MGIIVSNSFKTVDYTLITARSATTGYDKVNVMDRVNLKRRFRAADITTNDYLLKFRFVPTARIYGIFLNDVNFSAVRIEGNESDSWADPTYAGSDLTVSQNPITGRYQIFINLGSSGVNLEYWRIFIPSTATLVNSNVSFWEVGTVCFMTSLTELAHNMSYGYTQTGKHFYSTAVNDRVKTGEEIRWQGQLVFGNRSDSNETELWTLNQMDMSLPFFYYENDGDTSRGYLCVRDGSIQVNRFTYNGITGNSIAIKEAYMIGEN